MATNKKTGGLGANALFTTTPPPADAQPQAKSTPAPKEPSLRTTVMLPADVLILLNRMKEQSIRDGARQTQGEIIAEALRTLAKLRNIEA